MKKLFLLLAAGALFSGCLKDPDRVCNFDPCNYKAPDTEVQAVKAYLASAGITNAVQHCSGMFYIVQSPGTGNQPDACSNVAAIYKGQLTNGFVFDEATSPVPFNLSDVILGWASGIPLIKAGGKITLFIPPSLGYGPSDYQTIPGNSILIFDVELTGA